MTLIADIRARFMQARKERDVATTLSLSTFIGEAEMIGKSDGNRETTDSEVVALLKKFIKNAEEVEKYSKVRGIQLVAVETEVKAMQAGYAAQNEIKLFSSFLPRQFEGTALQSIVAGSILYTNATTVKDMGKVMADMKSRHEGQFDGAAASKLIKQLLT